MLKLGEIQRRSPMASWEGEPLLRGQIWLCAASSTCAGEMTSPCCGWGAFGSPGCLQGGCQLQPGGPAPAAPGRGPCSGWWRRRADVGCLQLPPTRGAGRGRADAGSIWPRQSGGRCRGHRKPASLFCPQGPRQAGTLAPCTGGRCWVEMSLGLQPGSLEFSVQLVPVGLCFGPSALSPGSVSSSVRREAVETEPPWLVLSAGRMVGLPLGQLGGGTLDLASANNLGTSEAL